LFALSDEKIENGAEYEFSLVNEKISIVSEDTSEPNELLAPISDNIELIGTFSKKEIKENRQRNIQFYYDIHGYSVEAPVENGYKINTIDGNDCYKKKYKYYINRNKVKLVSNAEEGIKASVEKVLNYGNAIYAKVRAEDDVFLITVDKNFDAKEVNIQFDSSDIEVYSTDIDMKIC
jgi:ABC-type sugar transport system ATPase subunit